MNAFEKSRLKSIHLDRTLIIIDMQDHFIGIKERDLIPIICELVRHARQNKWAIILVEYNMGGPTTEEILEAVKEYKRQEVVIKPSSNGGREIIECIDKKAWSPDILVCGIYGDLCVSETVAGLFDNSDLVEVDVVTDAIHPHYLTQSEKNEHGQQQEREVTLEEVGVTVTSNP